MRLVVNIKYMAVVLSFLLAAATATFIACSQSDTATVTIDTGLRQQASAKPLLLFDRLLALLNFGTKVLADGPPIQLSIDRITITVSGPGITALNDIEIPLDTGKKTIEVPAGVDRTFTVIGWQYSGQGDIYFREHGGVETTDLSPGASVELAITMGPLPSPPNSGSAVFTGGGTSLEWFFRSEPPDLVGFRIYRSNTSNGPYSLIKEGPKEYFFLNGYRYFDAGGAIGLYYRITSVNQYGEGEPGSAILTVGP